MNQVALITGSSRGLGQAFAASLKERGFKTFGVSRSEASVDHHYSYDLSTPSGVGELIVPDFTMGSGEQKTATMDLFIKEVAGR